MGLIERRRQAQGATAGGGQSPCTPSPYSLNYATKIAEEIGMPLTTANIEAVRAALEVLIHKGRLPARAFEFLLSKVLDALEQGEEITRVWFEGPWSWANGKHR